MNSQLAAVDGSQSTLSLEYWGESLTGKANSYAEGGHRRANSLLLEQFNFIAVQANNIYGEFFLGYFCIRLSSQTYWIAWCLALTWKRYKRWGFFLASTSFFHSFYSLIVFF